MYWQCHSASEHLLISMNDLQVSWVQPRVLTFPEMQGLCERLDIWVSKVKSVNLALEQETVGVVEV